MIARTLRRPLAAAVAATAFAIAPAVHAQPEGAFDPCEQAGRAQLETLLDTHAVPHPQDFAATWHTLFCGESTIRHAAQRVGFPFVERFTLHEGSRIREERNVLARDAFLANYAYLDRDHRSAGMTEVSSGLSYSAASGLVRMRFEGDAGAGSRAFRLWRGKWLWVDEQHVIEEGVEDDESGC